MIAKAVRAPLAERDTDRSAKEQGLFRKYDVRRIDGTADQDGAEYFVLRVGDPLALPALAAYAAAAEIDYPDLAADMRTRYQLGAPLRAAELDTIECLLVLAYAAWNLADNTEDGEYGLTVDRADFDQMSAALDSLDELPDDQPGYVMEAAAKARWALRGIVGAAAATSQDIPNSTDRSTSA